ncbi:MAG TPA: YhcH/YjgK/YiaL family protein [Planctomycetota bacterium]|nr:YhcH/YjgK/YiaL family protein [Planctomycetota bacterium]
MILTSLADAARYDALHPLFATAFAWLRANPDAPCGAHVIVADRLRALVDAGTTRDPAGGRLEAHRDHIDVHVALAGGELIEWASVGALAGDGLFDAEHDVGFFRDPPVPSVLALEPGHAAVFWPDDAHKPLCRVGGSPAAYRKVVFKVRLG